MLKSMAMNENLALALSEASHALKLSFNRKASETAVVQAALLRFLEATRPTCPYLGAFLIEPGDAAARIRAIADMARFAS